jgi:hypothetical protein
VDLPALDPAGIRDALREAIAGGAPVYLDALEIAARCVRNLPFVLRNCLTAAEAARVPWRLACRPAAWDGALAAALRSALPALSRLRLLPLTRVAAVDVVSEVTSRPGECLDEVIRAGMTGLAASPLWLQAAAFRWDREGHLPESQLSAIQYEVEHLLKESGQQDMTVLEDRRRRIAGRLAAMSVFGRADRFTMSSRPRAGALNAPSLPSRSEPDGLAEITLTEVSEVLGTALFDAVGDATVGFRHQQHAEFLAAEYVMSRRITRGQVRTLLGMNEGNTIPRPMIGAAAWLSVLKVELGSDFATANAGTLAESAVELPVRLREQVVGGILAQAAAEDMDTLPRQDLAALVHPDLGAQLGAHLSGGLTRPGELWWLSRLAQAGQCRELAAGLLQETLARPWAAWARRAAVTAVAALGDDAEVAQLDALACLSPDDDPEDDVLAAVIEALFPRLLDTTALMALLRPQRTPDYYGHYRVLLDGLGARIAAGELPAALSWATARAASEDDAYSALIPSLVQRGWDNVAAPGVRDQLGRLAAAVAVSSMRAYRSGRLEYPWLGSSPEPRRALAVRVAASLPPGDHFSLIDLGLLIFSDLGWLLGVLPSLDQPEQGALAQCASSLARRPTATEADLILQMPEDHPAYAHTRWLRGSVSTDSPQALRGRLRAAEATGDGQQHVDVQHQQYKQLTAALHDAGADPTHWWRVAKHLAPARPSAGELFSHDLTARPGWILLDAIQRQQVLDIGLLYLQQHQLRPSSWKGHPSIPVGHLDDAVADWSGVYLLSTLAEHDPVRLVDVAPATWRTWTSAIVGAWTMGGDEARDARRQLTDLVPGSERSALLDAAMSNLGALQANGAVILTNWGLYEHLCPDLAGSLAPRLTVGHYSGTLGQNLMHLLITRAPRDALPACRLIIATPGHALAAAARRGLAELDPAALISQLEASPTQLEDITDTAGHLRPSLLNDSQLADLARLLLRHVPLGSDPPIKLGVYDPDPLDEMRRVRRTVMDLLADHGQERFFRELAAQQDDDCQQVTGWYLRRARARATDRSYAGLAPDELLHLLGRADARLVRNGRDLLDVIVCQLDDIQRDLAQRGRSRTLWNLIGDRGTPMDENSITNEIADRLSVRLNASGLLDREVEVTPARRGIGTRIDLKATVPTATRPAGTASVIIEAKIATSKRLESALTSQLIRKYLVPTGCECGIYLVYWAKPEQWPGSPADPAELQRGLERQAAQAGDGIHVRPYILDISYS